MDWFLEGGQVCRQQQPPNPSPAPSLMGPHRSTLVNLQVRKDLCGGFPMGKGMNVPYPEETFPTPLFPTASNHFGAYRIRFLIFFLTIQD